MVSLPPVICDILASSNLLPSWSIRHVSRLPGRMPVNLGNKESTNTWLNGSSSSKFDMMLKPYEDSDLTSPVKGLKEDPIPIKEMKVEQESDLEQKNSCDKSEEGSQPKRLKREPVTADAFVKKGDDKKAKSSAYMLPNEETMKKQTKQEHEEFVADLKSGPDRRDKLDTILVKKKGW
ncbi:hypothetical protein LWI28_016199 [Acer negundo]|uniref:Uncharacterized protein n=1 Tax=Acer negundo TaxID=4023 RepID=A0AAD5IVQ6_ACENE|nr:hypothetical protein LWI28_016199 [Acer negundo]